MPSRRQSPLDPLSQQSKSRRLIGEHWNRVRVRGADDTTESHALAPTSGELPQLNGAQRAAQVFLLGEDYQEAARAVRARRGVATPRPPGDRSAVRSGSLAPVGRSGLARKAIAAAIADFDAALILDDTAVGGRGGGAATRTRSPGASTTRSPTTNARWPSDRIWSGRGSISPSRSAERAKSHRPPSRSFPPNPPPPTRRPIRMRLRTGARRGPAV